MRYRADITAGALKVPESRVVADLLLRQMDEAGWRKALYEENALQTRSRMTAKRLRTLIRGRLELMDEDHWRMVRDGTGDVATHACLAAAVKQSPLLGDFLDLVVRERFRLFAPSLTRLDWSEYPTDCRGRDPDMPEWRGVAHDGVQIAEERVGPQHRPDASHARDEDEILAVRPDHLGKEGGELLGMEDFLELLEDEVIPRLLLQLQRLLQEFPVPQVIDDELQQIDVLHPQGRFDFRETLQKELDVVTDPQFVFGWIVEDVEGDLVADALPREKVIGRVQDAMLFGDIQRAVAAETDVILFNIDSKADAKAGRDAVLTVFLKVLIRSWNY